jgi:hypothetical protein
MDEAHPVSVAAGTTRSRHVATRVETVSGALVAGALAGATIGGLGGRLAMLILRLTSDPSLRGLDTDDGFVIGIASTATLFLVTLTTLLGAFGGVVYLGIRRWMPSGARPWLAGAIAGAIGGAAAIRPGGIDFTSLDPLVLAVVMFIALPAAYGVAVSLLVERSLVARTGHARGRTWIAAIVFMLPLAFIGPTGIAVLLAAIAVLLWPPSPQIGELWRSAPVSWIGRAAIIAIVGRALIELVSDVLEIL